MLAGSSWSKSKKRSIASTAPNLRVWMLYGYVVEKIIVHEDNSTRYTVVAEHSGAFAILIVQLRLTQAILCFAETY